MPEPITKRPPSAAGAAAVVVAADGASVVVLAGAVGAVYAELPYDPGYPPVTELGAA